MQNEHDALYLQLLFALKDRHVGVLESRFSCIVLDTFRLLEVNIDPIFIYPIKVKIFTSVPMNELLLEKHVLISD